MAWSETSNLHTTSWTPDVIADLARGVGHTYIAIEGGEGYDVTAEDGTVTHVMTKPGVPVERVTDEFQAIADQASALIADLPSGPIDVTLADTGATVTPCTDVPPTSEESEARSYQEMLDRQLVDLQQAIDVEGLRQVISPPQVFVPDPLDELRREVEEKRLRNELALDELRRTVEEKRLRTELDREVQA